MDGTAGFADRSYAPHRRPGRTQPRLEQSILGLRARRLSGPRIAHLTGLARATAGHVLRRHGLGRLPSVAPKLAVRRYERAHPGELVHVDTKALGCIAGVGHRIHGDRTTRVRGIG